MADSKTGKDRRKKNVRDPSGEYIRLICSLYHDSYDDREEDSRPGGRAGHRDGKRCIHRWKRSGGNSGIFTESN